MKRRILVEHDIYRTEENPFASFRVYFPDETNLYYLDEYVGMYQFRQEVESAKDIFNVLSEHYLTSHLDMHELHVAAEELWFTAT